MVTDGSEAMGGNDFPYFPKYCVWELTLRCNMRCRHCGSFAGLKRGEELSYARMLKLVDELAALGTERVTLSGGEPTLHPRWHYVATRIKNHGISVNIISNGWSWTDNETRVAINAGLSNVAFSLDGFEKDHDIVRCKGSFSRVVKALSSCVDASLPVSVITHINRLNVNSLREFRKFLGSIGVRVWQLQLGVPAGVMCEHSDLVVDADDLLWIVPLIAGMKRDKSVHPYIDVADNIGYFGKFESELRTLDWADTAYTWRGCIAGCYVVGIESDGTIKGCLSLPSDEHGTDVFSEGTVRDSTLEKIWHRKTGFSFNRNFDTSKLYGFCATCPYRETCRAGCTWMAFSHSGSRYDQPYCFYRQARLSGREDLIDDECRQRETIMNCAE
jgi:radical SAM protein with 4Fe4S-binding SPASM domain